MNSSQLKEKNQKSTLCFHGGVGTVTGANFILRHKGYQLMVDCGLIQGTEKDVQLNYESFGYDPSSIDTLIVTHAHMDHIGRIPKLYAEGFRGGIYSTAPTRDLSATMFEDALTIMEYNMKKDPTFKPLYTKDDVAGAMSLWKTEDYHHTLPLGNDIEVTLQDAGHILGSAMVRVRLVEQNKNVLFTGDLGNSPSPLLPDTEPIEGIDVMVMESVYGDRNHEQRDERSQQLEQFIEETINKGGTVIIPVFAVERTQELLLEINNLVEGGEIPRVPVYLDAPLAQRVTSIYRDYTDFLKKEIRDQIKGGDDIFAFPGFKITETTEESKAINEVSGPKIILAGSGMSNGGRVLHHYLRYLDNPNNTVIFVGFQSAGTLGRMISDRVRTVSIYDNEIDVKARIERITGYSGHKQRDDLIDFVEQTKNSLSKVWVTMGETESSTFLAQRLRDYLGVHAIVPSTGECAEL